MMNYKELASKAKKENVKVCTEQEYNEWLHSFNGRVRCYFCHGGSKLDIVKGLGKDYIIGNIHIAHANNCPGWRKKQ